MRTEQNFSRTFSATVFAFILTVCVVPQHEGRAPTASITPLAIPAAGSLSVTAHNQAGQVASYYYNVDGLTQRAFLWSAGVVYDLGTLGGANAVANGLNASGSVAGYSSLAAATPRSTERGNSPRSGGRFSLSPRETVAARSAGVRGKQRSKHQCAGDRAPFDHRQALRSM
jgi:probable HAF family extracellular repeat protein